MLRIGLISDTHGLLRPQAEQFLAGCDHIVHAGDIGQPAILERLAALAPLTAIRGNNDGAGWAAALPEAQALQLGGVTLFVLHDLKQLALHQPPPGTQVIVCGHSHKPQILRRPADVLVVNPGSAGPRRFTLPVSAAELLVRGPGEVEARLVELQLL
jgi:putative phosphoesterase